MNLNSITKPFWMLIFLLIANTNLVAKDYSNYCNEDFRHILIEMSKHQSQSRSYNLYTIDSWWSLIDQLQGPLCSTQLGDFTSQWQKSFPQHPLIKLFPKLFRGTFTEGKTIRSKPLKVGLILPNSEQYPSVHQLLKNELRKLNSPRFAIDIQLFEASPSLQNIAQMVKEKDLHCVIGPLPQSDMLQWETLEVNIPTLYLSTFKSKIAINPLHFQLSLSDDSLFTQLQQNIKEYFLFNGILLFERSIVAEDNLVQLIRNHQKWGQWLDINEISSIQDKLNQRIKQILRIVQSEARFQQLQHRLAEENIKFIPRRRQDIDFISLFVQPQQLYSLVPLLRYWNTQDITIFALMTESAMQNKMMQMVTAHDDLQGVIAMVPAWYQTSANSSSLFDAKIRYLIRKAFSLVKNTQCLQLDDFINSTSSLGWQLYIPEKTFIPNLIE